MTWTLDKIFLVCENIYSICDKIFCFSDKINFIPDKNVVNETKPRDRQGQTRSYFGRLSLCCTWCNEKNFRNLLLQFVYRLVCFFWWLFWSWKNNEEDDKLTWNFEKMLWFHWFISWALPNCFTRRTSFSKLIENFFYIAKICLKKIYAKFGLCKNVLLDLCFNHHKENLMKSRYQLFEMIQLT